MKFKAYLKKLNELAENYPEALKYDVIYSRDDEGNAFQKVGYAPTFGHIDEYNIYVDAEYLRTEELNDPINAICIN